MALNTDYALRMGPYDEEGKMSANLDEGLSPFLFSTLFFSPLELGFILLPAT